MLNQLQNFYMNTSFKYLSVLYEFYMNSLINVMHSRLNSYTQSSYFTSLYLLSGIFILFADYFGGGSELFRQYKSKTMPTFDRVFILCEELYRVYDWIPHTRTVCRRHQKQNWSATTEFL